MRIAMIGQKRTGSREGGVEVVVGELARRMADLGHQVTCYDRMGEGAPSEPYEKDGYRIVPVRLWTSRGSLRSRAALPQQGPPSKTGQT